MAFKMKGFSPFNVNKLTTSGVSEDSEMTTPYSPSWDPDTGEGDLTYTGEGFENMDLSYLDDKTLANRIDYLMKYKPKSIVELGRANDELKMIKRETARRYKSGK